MLIPVVGTAVVEGVVGCTGSGMIGFNSLLISSTTYGE